MEGCWLVNYRPALPIVGSCSKGYRYGSVGCDASRTSEARDQVWRRHSDTLQRHLSSFIDSYRGSGSKTRWPLRFERLNETTAAVPDDSRTRPDRDHPPAPTERDVSVPHQPAQVSRFHLASPVLALAVDLAAY